MLNPTLTQTYNVSPQGTNGTVGSVFKIAGDLPAIGGIVRSLTNIGGALGIKGKSPRYGGGDGPLYSTVNAFIARIVSGETAVIEQLNQLRAGQGGAPGRPTHQWQQFWSTDMLRVPMSAEQQALVKRMDPSIAAQLAHAQGQIGAPSPSATNYPLANFADPFAATPQGGGSIPTGAASPANYVVIGALIVAALFLVRK